MHKVRENATKLVLHKNDFIKTGDWIESKTLEA